MKTHRGVIAKVQPDSLAARAGIRPGDKIVSVNDREVHDLIDLTFALADEDITLVVENELGSTQAHYFQRRFGEHVGIELETAVFDSIRQCANRCVFCFIDQMPEGLRESLYVKDDDYRMSFLHGNYITLTNMGPRDWERIRSFHLSPLYISIHTMDGALRKQMMQHRQADRIVEYMRNLEKDGIEVHVQIVMCPGYNDGEALRYTLQTLYEEYSNVLDVAVVPVGLSRYREGLAPLLPVDKEKALETIALVEPFQNRARRERQHAFVYLADEFYILAEQPYPASEAYDGFPLIEDGIGMGRKFQEDWTRYRTKDPYHYEKPLDIVLVTGTAIGDTMTQMAHSLAIPNLHLEVLPVPNDFFGHTIHVTGLLTAQDIIKTITESVKKRGRAYDGVIIPGVCLRKGVPIFLDDATIEDVATALQTEVRVCHFATDLLEQLYHWR